MKRLLVVLTMCFGISIYTYAQNVDLNLIPRKEREKLLFEIATEAMKKYAPSYYREDLKPVFVVEYIEGYDLSKNYGKMVYIVEFPYDITNAKEGDNIYGGRVGIVGETGRAYGILPLGWMIEFKIPDESDVPSGAHGSPHQVAKPTTVPRSRYIRVE